MVKKFSLPDYNYEVTIGKYAKQADGAVWIQKGGTVVLSTVVSAPSKDFPGFLPLTVDYREHFSAAGKIPGGYYKREGKSSDREVLISRLIDRSIRPLFPINYFDQLQSLSTVYSVDKENSPAMLALNSVSLALCLSKIPFLEPLGAVEVARVDGTWQVNPNHQDVLRADARLVMSGTDEGITMVEGSCQEISEDEFVDTLFMAHGHIKKLVAWQREIIAEMGLAKEPIADTYQWQTWQSRIETFLTEERVRSVNLPDKVDRNAQISKLQTEFADQYKEESKAHEALPAVITYIFDYVLKDKLTELLFALNNRIDGRKFDQIRDISVEVGLLPYTHGSSLFTRGRTQALVSVTLGGGSDEQKLESIMDAAEQTGTFMLHYNFPPFSVGEVRPMRGPGRREVGHGHLAASALKAVLPNNKDFPYTIRIVADMLESDGSTSMATACGSTMALMQAGVPLTGMVGGVAMGLLKSNTGRFAVLSDISGFEDAFGLMDFKVVGTDKGITAIQMDIKYKGGLSRDIFQVALTQARQGRLHILGEMRKVMTQPNPTLSELVPKLISLKVNPDKIGAIIGTGGKVIREIIKVTGTMIDIESDGTVKVFGPLGSNMDMAVNWVKTLSGQMEIGAIYKGKVRKLAEFGIFVELVPGVDGLVHISQIPKAKQRTFLRDFKPDDQVSVRVLDYDEATGRIRLELLDNG